MDISKKLKHIRVDFELTQAQAAGLVHVTQNSWARYESGERRPPPIVLEMICLKLGLPYPETFEDGTATGADAQ